MASDLEVQEGTLTSYEKLLKSMSVKKRYDCNSSLRKRKKELSAEAHGISKDQKLQVDDFKLLTEDKNDDDNAILQNKEIEKELEDDKDDHSDNCSVEDEEDVFTDHTLIKDPFKVHFEQDLGEDTVENIKKSEYIKNKLESIMGSIITQFNVNNDVPRTEILMTGKEKALVDVKVSKKLSDHWDATSRPKDGVLLTDLQRELFNVLNNYQDVLYPQRTFSNGEEIRELYCMHAVNHIFKTRSKILKNNEKISQAEKEGKEADEFRDHGLTRPKVLIVVPFRDACLRVVNQIIKLALTFDGKTQVMQKKRFYDEYKDSSEDNRSKVSYVPEDFKAMFTGNIDDCFRIGVTILRRAVRLYAEFYSSDIIIASPLGLRTIIGAEGESDRDFDFLSSIEVLILDQADVFLMQNWDHVLHVLEHMNLQPKEAHGTDFSRVRLWSLNGWSNLYRQTVLFSSFMTPEINHVFNKYCTNYAGKVQICPPILVGSIQQIASQIPQVFHKIECEDHVSAAEKRFNFFIKKILPEFKGKLTNKTGIFVSNYFDFVRLRNYFKKHDISFLQINEYSKRSNISKARTLFNEGKKQFLVFTERFYFFYRYRVKGMRHVIFYELPQYSLFYPEILNFLQSGTDTVSKAAGTTCTVIYTKYDTWKLKNIVGNVRAKKLVSSQKSAHMLVSGS